MSRVATTKRQIPRKPADRDVFLALADPNRRAMLDLLRDGPKTTGQIASRFLSTRFAVMKHLRVLEGAGLVIVRRHGRERWNYLNAIPLQQVYDRWVTPYRALWAPKLTSLKAGLEGAQTMTTTTPAPVSPFIRVELEIRIDAPRDRVWKALVEDTTFWWPRDFYTGPARGFHIEPRLGGRVYEDWGNGAGAVWYTVFALNPNTSLDLQGAMAVPFGPAFTLLHVELEDDGTTTILKLSDSTLGESGADCGGTKEQGWTQVFSGGLKAYVEKHSRNKGE